MNPIHKLNCGYVVDLRKIQIVSSIKDNEFFMLLDHDGAITLNGTNNEGLTIDTVHDELLQAWKDYNAVHQA